ncbi:MAG: hypothetical protein ACKO3B_11770 [Bacteroidota bacterium]
MNTTYIVYWILYGVLSTGSIQELSGKLTFDLKAKKAYAHMNDYCDSNFFGYLEQESEEVLHPDFCMEWDIEQYLIDRNDKGEVVRYRFFLSLTDPEGTRYESRINVYHDYIKMIDGVEAVVLARNKYDGKTVSPEKTLQLHKEARAALTREIEEYARKNSEKQPGPIGTPQ